MKRILILASVASMISQFNMENIRLLKKLGYEVHVACNFNKGSTCDEASVLELQKLLKSMQVFYFQVDFSREVTDIRRHVRAYRQVMRLLRKNQYDFIHCHSPIGGIIGRIAAHFSHTKVIYTAHGFHFYKGAPIKNWLLYFPIEWFCAFWTDILITINKEDYHFANYWMRAKKVKYIPGIGIDLKRFQGQAQDGESIRRELGLKDNDFLLLSIGELNKNKNHETVIKAMAEMKNTNLHYAVAGQGDLSDYLQKKAVKYKIIDRVHFVGYRSDVERLYKAADIYIMPSLREGLSVSLMEAMASGLPVVCSKVRGNVDLIEEGKGGYLCNAGRPEEFRRAICRLVKNERLRREMGRYNREKVKEYSAEKVETKMRRIYIDCLSC